MDLLQTIAGQFHTVTKEVHSRGLFTMAVIRAENKDNVRVGVGFAKRGKTQTPDEQRGTETALRRAMTDILAPATDDDHKVAIPECLQNSKIFNTIECEQHIRNLFIGTIIRGYIIKNDKTLMYTGVGLSKQYQDKTSSSVGEDTVKKVSMRRALDDLFYNLQKVKD